jgi:hypothetical protein
MKASVVRQFYVPKVRVNTFKKYAPHLSVARKSMSYDALKKRCALAIMALQPTPMTDYTDVSE